MLEGHLPRVIYHQEYYYTKKFGHVTPGYPGKTYAVAFESVRDLLKDEAVSVGICGVFFMLTSQVLGLVIRDQG